MNDQLRKRNVNACTVQRFLDRNDDVGSCRVIICGLNLTAGIHTDTGICHFRNIHGHVLFVLYIRTLQNLFTDLMQTAPQIRVITYIKSQFKIP